MQFNPSKQTNKHASLPVAGLLLIKTTPVRSDLIGLPARPHQSSADPSQIGVSLRLESCVYLYSTTTCFNHSTATMKPVIGLLAVAGLVYRAWARKSLTPLGLVVAGASATAHALHPWSTPFALLAVFYYGGTKVTKV